MNYLIVGCGVSGAVLARVLAEKGHKITVIDRRNHVAGNCYDFFDEDNICVHQYGTHIFHTDDKKVWDFVSRFTQWFPYQHKVLGLIDGMEVPIPFNLNSISQVFPEKIANRLTDKLIDKFGFNVKVPILELRKTGDEDLAFLADYVYEKIFLHYTLKQWGLKPDELAPSVTGRVPVYISRDNRYFQNKYQGIPLEGYTTLVERMLDNPNIEVKLGVSYTKDMSSNHDMTFHTGPIDEYFDYCLGELPYRSLHFEFIRFNRQHFQSNAVINYPCNYDFTRIGEYKYFLDNQSDSTVVSYEYPQAFVNGVNERYYPINTENCRKLYADYLEKAKAEDNIVFLGRLGDYKYYDMDKAIGRALELGKSY